MSSPAPISLPTDGWADWLQSTVDTHLATARRVLDELKDGRRRNSAEVLDAWNDADIALGGAAALTGLLAEVHPDSGVRELAEKLAQDIDRLSTDRGLDRDLFEVVDGSDPAGLDEQATRMRERVLRDFRRSGVDRSEDARTRLRELAERLTVVDQDFARLAREDVRSIRITPDRLAGLPQDFIDAHPAGADGLVTITTDYPDYLPFRSFAHDADARRELTVEFLNRAWPAADPVLAEMLTLRDEQARILGYASWPDFDAGVKMIGSSQAIAEFIERLSDAADASGRRDKQVLMARLQQDRPEVDTLVPADTGYYQEIVRREHYDVDSQQVRRYFDFGRVRAGLLDVTGRLFGVEYRPVDAATWHPDVAVYDVVRDGIVMGRIHLDLHPRDGKFKHAAQFTVVDGVAGRQMPEGALVCNFSRGLMEHQDVVTLFHEFGHLVHHVLGGHQRWVRFSGVATEWDFVEAPSQMLEEWAWDADVLQTFAADEDGNPIPRDLVARMAAADDFGKGLWVRTQLFYTALAFVLYRDRPADTTATVQDLQKRYDMIDYLPGTHFQAAFGHLAGYTSSYYTYLWSLVIAKDLFATFDPDDLFAADVAHRYRDRILAPGGTRDAADLVADFLGRPFQFDAFAAWLDRGSSATS